MRESQIEYDQDLGAIRSFFSLSERQARAITAALANVPGAWVLDRHEGWDGHLMLLLTAADGGDDAPTYTIDRDATSLHLRVLQQDNYRALGTFSAVEDLMAALRSIVGMADDPADVTHAA